MTDRLPLALGIVGSRAYEAAAWYSPGPSAVEKAAWARSVAPAKAIHAANSRLVRGRAAVSVIANLIALFGSRILAKFSKLKRYTRPE